MRNSLIWRRVVIGTLLLALLFPSISSLYAAPLAAVASPIFQEPAPDPPATRTSKSPFTSLLQPSQQFIKITDAGPIPSTLDIFGPTDVTWRNTTAVTVTLRSGDPVAAPSGQQLFLPSISRSSSSFERSAPKVRAAQIAFDIVLPPNGTFTQRYTAPGEQTFHLVERPEQIGAIRLNGTVLLATSPSHNAIGIASTRETLLTFSGPIDLSTVTTATVQAFSGGQSLAARLHLSEEKQRVTLFYAEPLPGSARVEVRVDGNGLKDASGRLVDVDGDGVAGGQIVISFDTLSLTVIPGTKVCGTVYASELGTAASGVSVDVPLNAAAITVDGREADLHTTSDASGNFCLDPAPAGRFFVHVDGRSASNPTAAGAYYPFVGKSWTSTPGTEVNVGHIYLPLVVPGTLQPVSAVEDTVIRFPQSVLDQFPDFVDVAVTVPAGSLINQDGTPGGKVGIAPVPPDRLPGTLPPGLDFPLVITVQTDGAGNFDTPAPVCFPNTPNPTTGQPLPAGSASSIWSFNHDSGRFELSGPATVSADGRLVCSDPGVGIVAPGWHGQTAASLGVHERSPSSMPPWFLHDLNTAEAVCDIESIRGLKSCAASTMRSAIRKGIGDTLPICLGGTNIYCTILSQADDIADLYTLDELVNETRDEFQTCVSQYSACQAAIHDPLARTHQPDDAAEALMALLSESFAKEEKLREFQTQVPLVLGNAQQQSDLSQSQIAQLEQLLAGLQPLFGDELPSTVMRPLYARISRLGTALATQDNLFLSEAAYYVLENQTTGTIERGRTETAGAISGLILRPNSVYRLRLLFPSNFTFGESRFRSSEAGQVTEIPRAGLIPLLAATVYGTDSDNDELLDVAEFVIGTDSAKADTDGDGIGDGAEVAQGSNPLSGILARTGIVASADTPGSALELCIHENLAAVADSAMGVALFNVFNRTTPTLINQIAAPGNTIDVACATGRVVAVGDGGDVSILDVSDPASARIVHTLNSIVVFWMAGGFDNYGEKSCCLANKK